MTETKRPAPAQDRPIPNHTNTNQSNRHCAVRGCVWLAQERHADLGLVETELVGGDQ